MPHIFLSFFYIYYLFLSAHYLPVHLWCNFLVGSLTCSLLYLALFLYVLGFTSQPIIVMPFCRLIIPCWAPFCREPALTKITLARVRVWRFRNIVKKYEDINENNKMETHIG